MVFSRESLKEYIEADNSWYCPKQPKAKLVATLARYPQWRLKRYLCFLRKQEYHINTANGNKLKGILGLYYEYRKNRLGEVLGIEISPNCFDKGLQLYHGGVVVNSSAKIGKNCKFHGSNCIGNDGKTTIAPKLGNNIDIGYGAVIIGDIFIADDCIIGANALVNRSFTEPGSIIAGIPAKKIQ